MLLWELCSEQIPYKNLKEPDEIKEHVLNGKREKFSFGREMQSEDVEIQKEFANIISKSECF